ncbi:heavy metal-associated isoprenylated plant protein 17-like [Brassica napus]|nr:heavy metal-associated isoprenylated plant protein 17-like [Brassica napus]
MVGCFWSKRSPPVYNSNSVVVNAELKIGMHCKNCAKRVREVVFYLNGVRQCDVDLDTQKVMVAGDFNLDEVVETVKRKLGKRVEVLTSTKKSDVVSNEDGESEIVPEKNEEAEIVLVLAKNEESEIIPEKNEEVEIVPEKNEEPEIVLEKNEESNIVPQKEANPNGCTIQ